MAIDWGRVAKGVATGYLGAKIANTEANDTMNADIIKRAGLNFYENTLPEFQKKETSRKETYGKVSAQYGSDVAEYMDQNGFIVGDASDYKNIVTLLGSNDGLNETKLKAYLEATSAGTYGERAEKRVTSIQDREKTIMGLTSGSSKIGNMTAELLVDGGKEIPTAATEIITTPAVEGSQVGPVITEAVPEKTETREIPLPTYEEIFGDTAKAETVYLKMGRKDKLAIKKVSNTEFDKNFEDKLTGDVKIPEIYEEAYKALPEAEKKKFTEESYARQKWFEEVFLPDQGYSYTTPLPQDIIEGSNLINYYNSIGDDKMVNEIKTRLKNAGYDLTDYNL
tara:strand:+ start:362 stop:1375 length:1014 start_codon:yes stop_codon:yes gene_type:complete